MRLLIATPVAIALLSTPAFAEEQPKPEDKIICKRSDDYVTGTRLARPKKVCMKASEWKESENEKDRSMRRLQDGRVNPNQPGAAGGGPG